jgi:hypothetical protein
VTKTFLKGSFYDILGVTPAAPGAIIAAAYRAWMKTLGAHPDLGGDEAFAKTLNLAYETLSDPGRRALYDASISGEHAVPLEWVRHARRVSVNAEAAYCTSPDDTWQRAQLLDMSLLGLRMRIPSVLAVGQHVAIGFPRRAAAAVEAEVRWSKHLDGVEAWRCEVGVEFFAPRPDLLVLFQPREE